MSKSSSEPRIIHPPRLTVHITQDHINRGVACNSKICVVAIAIQEAHEDWTHVCVDAATTRISDPKRRLRFYYFTPRVLQQLILDVDKAKDDPKLRAKIKPLSVQLRAGQVTPMRISRPAEQRPRKTKRTARRLIRSGGGSNVPVVVGGKAPPKVTGFARGGGLRGVMV